MTCSASPFSEEISLNTNLEKKSRLEIEKSLIKKYRKDIWSKFIKAIKEYELIGEGDKVAVAISGGKDSLLLAKLLQELQQHGPRSIELEFIAMDPGYARENRIRLEENCKHLGIPLQIFDTDVFAVADKIAGEYPCYMCARMRRGALYAKAKELGCNKLALGHHFNDVIETTMLNLLCAGSYKTMMPKLFSDNFKGIQIIRPLYLIREEMIIRWIRWTGVEALDCACRVASKKLGSQRARIKQLIEELGADFRNVDISIFRSAQNVNLDMVLGYQQRGEKHFFLEGYEDWKKN